MSLGVSPGYLLQGLTLHFIIFINDIFLYTENFSDDNRFFSSVNNFCVIMKSLDHDAKTFLRWFNLNALKVNPGKFQFMMI